MQFSSHLMSVCHFRDFRKDASVISVSFELTLIEFSVSLVNSFEISARFSKIEEKT